MKISTSSWHYKLIDVFFSNGPADRLCPYFWQLVASVFVCLFGLTVVAFLGWNVGCLGMIVSGYAPEDVVWWMHALLIIPGILALGAFIAAVGGIAFGVLTGYGYLKAKASSKLQATKQSNEKVRVAVDFGEALHSKVCPFIQFEDEPKRK